MIKGVHDIYYNVTDMKRAVKFYSEVLSMEVSYESDHWTSMNCGGTLTLNSDNVSEDRKTLESAAAKILGEMDADWGHMLVFEDLDGNVLKLQNAKY